jgi:hypothetical protein
VPVDGPSAAPSFFFGGAVESPHPDTASIAIAAHVSHIRGARKIEPSLLVLIDFLQNCSKQKQPPD